MLAEGWFGDGDALTEIEIYPSVNPGRWLTLSKSPSTIVHDIKTSNADAVSPALTPVYTSNDVLDVLRALWGVF